MVWGVCPAVRLHLILCSMGRWYNIASQPSTIQWHKLVVLISTSFEESGFAPGYIGYYIFSFIVACVHVIICGVLTIVSSDDDSWNLVTCFCRRPFAGRPMIECSKCQTWVHLYCAKIKKDHVPDTYFCPKCSDSSGARSRS